MDQPADKKTILSCLKHGELQVEGQFMWGSNYTFLCNLTYQNHQLKAVYKPVRGERPLWDFPNETLAGREVAAYLVSEYAGWDFVPLTIYRQDAPSGPGSLQQYIEHDPEHHYFKFTPEERQLLRSVAVFDAVINNTDRKGGHVMVDNQGKLWLIDHGVCFHTQPKLRTVIWDFAGQPLPTAEIERIRALHGMLNPEQPLHQELCQYLSLHELRATQQRITDLLEEGVFPSPVEERYSYPWPPV